MHITQIIASIDDEAAGPSYTVPKLAQSLTERGHDISLMSLKGEEGRVEKSLSNFCFKRDFVGIRGMRRLGFSHAMQEALSGCKTEVFHTHGLWMMPNVYPAWAAKKTNKPLVLSPRGMLGSSALQFSAKPKKLFWAVYQGAAARAVSCFHATCDEEYNDIRAYGLKQPVAIIPNGIDVLEQKEHIAPSGNPTIVSLGRIHPKKALDRLILAFKELESDFPNWQLKIVGPSEVGYAEELLALTKRINANSVSISGPIFGGEKQTLLRRAELFALSTLNENFGMTVAESLAVGTPVISTKGAPWQGLEENNCGWWIDHGVEPLAATLRTAMSLSDEERHAMGKRGRAWMKRDFSWEGIGQEMERVYLWLRDGGDPPECVRLD